MLAAAPMTTEPPTSTFVDAFRESLREFPLEPQSSVIHSDLTQTGKGLRGENPLLAADADRLVAALKARTSMAPAIVAGGVGKVGAGSLDLTGQSGAKDDFKSGGATAVMTVKVSRVAPCSKQAAPKIYPFSPLKTDQLVYRGFPLDAGHSMKRQGRWKVQLVPNLAGAPTEPLPAFPEMSCLRRAADGVYHADEMISLEPEERLANSGKTWQNPKRQPPLSHYFWAAARPNPENSRPNSDDTTAGCIPFEIHGKTGEVVNPPNLRIDKIGSKATDIGYPSIFDEAIRYSNRHAASGKGSTLNMYSDNPNAYFPQDFDSRTHTEDSRSASQSFDH